MTELRATLALALPVVAAELGWMAMGVVDTLMVGRVGPEALGAVGIGRTLFFSFAVLGLGLVLGLDPLVSSAHGAGRRDETREWLVQGLWLTLGAALPVTAGLHLLAAGLDGLGIEPSVVVHARPYLRAIAWSTLPLIAFFALRRYLQAVGRVRSILFALITANLVNAVANWVLIFGRLGIPALGAAGAGWATAISCVYLTVVLAVVARLDAGASIVGRPRTAMLRRLLSLGIPAAGQLGVEIAVFAAATALVGRLQPMWSAAHQIALTAASVTYMVPLGISSAGAVRVGRALGRGDRDGARRAGWVSILVAGTFMLAAAAVLVTIPGTLVRAFSDDAEVIAAGTALLMIAAWFQLFDGLQVSATGVLRGAGDTRSAFALNVLGHWVLGLPIGYWLCFVRGHGAVGLWTGWLIGLAVCGVVLTGVWARRMSE